MWAGAPPNDAYEFIKRHRPQTFSAVLKNREILVPGLGVSEPASIFPIGFAMYLEDSVFWKVIHEKEPHKL